MIAACALVYVEPIRHAPHRAVIVIDSTKCEPGSHDYGRGLRISYGTDGQNITIYRTTLTIETITVPLEKRIGNLKVQNLGPFQEEAKSEISF